MQRKRTVGIGDGEGFSGIQHPVAVGVGKHRGARDIAIERARGHLIGPHTERYRHVRFGNGLVAALDGRDRYMQVQNCGVRSPRDRQQLKACKTGDRHLPMPVGVEIRSVVENIAVRNAVDPDGSQRSTIVHHRCGNGQRRRRIVRTRGVGSRQDRSVLLTVNGERKLLLRIVDRRNGEGFDQRFARGEKLHVRIVDGVGIDTARIDREMTEIAGIRQHDVDELGLSIGIENRQLARCRQDPACGVRILGHIVNQRIADHRCIVDTVNIERDDLGGPVKRVDREGIGVDRSTGKRLNGNICDGISVVAVRCEREASEIPVSGSHTDIERGLSGVGVGDCQLSGRCQVTARRDAGVFRHVTNQRIADDGCIVDTLDVE